MVGKLWVRFPSRRGGGPSSPECTIRASSCFGIRSAFHVVERRKEEALDGLRGRDERGPSSIRRTLELFQRQTLGKPLTDVVERIWSFPSAYIPS